FFLKEEEGIGDWSVTGVQTVLFRSQRRKGKLFARRQVGELYLQHQRVAAGMGCACRWRVSAHGHQRRRSCGRCRVVSGERLDCRSEERRVGEEGEWRVGLTRGRRNT